MLDFMSPIVHAIAALALALTAPGTLLLALLTAGLLLPRPRRRAGLPVRLAVVVPAHNEERLLPRCLASLARSRTDLVTPTVVVVADNCDDATASVARDANALVLERDDRDRRGKGFALDYAFRTLASEEFDGYLVVDADSVVTPNAIEAVGRALSAGADAVQLPYGILNGDDGARTRLLRLALMAFNHARPAARDRLGLSAGILGNGFGVRRSTLDAVPYECTSVTEDLEYHLRLVASGRRVAFVDEASVSGEMPVGSAAAATQRARWEGGRARMLREYGVPLVRGVLRGQVRLLEPLADLLLAPLAYHLALLLLAVVGGTDAVRAVALFGIVVLAAHVAGSVLAAGGGWRDLAPLRSVPGYMFWKLLHLPATLRAMHREAAWVRSARDGMGA